ncbi:MAG: hypothetical protein LBT21_06360 [Oscillospiraceae bacterium]|jgi:hypothetical protein|nr:hypothetical protein [Oscillospiraceae bacterium]
MAEPKIVGADVLQWALSKVPQPAAYLPRAIVGRFYRTATAAVGITVPFAAIEAISYPQADSVKINVVVSDTTYDALSFGREILAALELSDAAYLYGLPQAYPLEGGKIALPSALLPYLTVDVDGVTYLIIGVIMSDSESDGAVFDSLVDKGLGALMVSVEPLLIVEPTPPDAPEEED